MGNWLNRKKAERFFPQFEFVGELAGGGQKATFHVRSATFDDKMEDLCLKVLHPSYGDKERFNREVDLLSELPAHKNLTTLVMANTALVGGSRISFFCESMIFGKELDLPKVFSDKWSEQRTSEFFAQICDGVEVLSNNKIVHRDLKPANIIVRDDGTPVIVDLGIARGLNYSTLTDEFQPGTLAYMSPEQLRGERQSISVATDLYCVGLMMFESLTGRHPFFCTGVDSNELLRRSQRPRDIIDSPCFAHVSPVMRVVVADLLIDKPEDRLSDPKELGRRLRAIAAPAEEGESRFRITGSDAWVMTYSLGGLVAVFASALHESVLVPGTPDMSKLELYKGRNFEILERIPTASSPSAAADVVASFASRSYDFWTRYKHVGGRSLSLGELLPVCLIGYYSVRSEGLEIFGGSVDWLDLDVRNAAVEAGGAFVGENNVKAPSFRDAFALLAPKLLVESSWNAELVLNLFLQLYLPAEVVTKLSFNDLVLSIDRNKLLSATTGAMMQSVTKGPADERKAENRLAQGD